MRCSISRRSGGFQLHGNILVQFDPDTVTGLHISWKRMHSQRIPFRWFYIFGVSSYLYISRVWVKYLKNCPSKFSCYKCNKRHNTLLHREQGSDKQTTSSANTSPHSTSKQNSLQSTSSGSGGIIHTCFSSQSKGVLLGTAIVQICHNGLTYIVRALVD